MSIRIVCPNCHTAYNAADEQRGQRVRCRQCQAIFRAPDVPPPGSETGGTAARVKDSAQQQPAATPSGTAVDARQGKPSPKRKPARKIPVLGLLLILGGGSGSLLIIAASIVICVWLWNHPPDTWSAAKA